MTTATLWGMLTPLFVSLQIALTQINSTFELLHLGVDVIQESASM